MDSVHITEQVEQTLIAADMRLFINMLADPRLRPIHGPLAMAMMPFFSAFVLDSYKYVARKFPEIAKAIAPNREVLAESRLRLKPLEIHGKRFEEILEETDLLARISSGLFAESHPRFLKPVYRLLQKDLGVFFMDGEVVCTTHLALMNMGVTEETLAKHSLSLDNLGSFMHDITVDYGSYMASLYWVLVGEYANTSGVRKDYELQMRALSKAFRLFPNVEPEEDHKADDSLSIPYRDFHSEPFYERLTKGQGREQTAVFILILAAMSQVNIARLLIPTIAKGHFLSALKMRFLSLYHATNTLNRLVNQSRNTSNLMHPEALEHIREALSNASVRRVRKMKNLRNNFIHYGIHEHVVPHLSENRSLAGLVEAHTGGLPMVNLWDEVSAGLDHVAAALNPLLPNDLAAHARVDLSG